MSKLRDPDASAMGVAESMSANSASNRSTTRADAKVLGEFVRRKTGIISTNTEAIVSLASSVDAAVAIVLLEACRDIQAEVAKLSAAANLLYPIPSERVDSESTGREKLSPTVLELCRRCCAVSFGPPGGFYVSRLPSDGDRAVRWVESCRKH